MASLRNRALIYIRKSIVRNASDTVSPERQRQACLDEARRHGWLVDESDIYVDAEGHQSGRDDNRPDWQRLRLRVRDDASIAAVIVESLSRASRSVRSFYGFVDELRARGIALVSLKEHFDTSGAIGQAMLGFIAIVNQLESDLASERMRANIGFKKSSGRHWGRTPFGCEREAITGALLPSTETYTLDGSPRLYYDALQQCYRRYADGEIGYKALAVELNAEGWRFRGKDGQPRRWDPNNTRSVLALHRVYAGWVPSSGHNKDIAPQDNDTVWIEANYQPVLDVDLCDRVRDVLARRTITWRRADPDRRRYVHDYTLTGTLYCAECGQRLRGYRGPDGERHYRHATRGECPQPWSDATALESSALDLLDALIPSVDVIDGLKHVLLEAFGALADEERRAERDHLYQEIRRLQGEMDRLVDLAVSADLDADTYNRALRSRTEELGVLTARQAELDRRASLERRDLDRVIERLQTVQSLIREASADMQKHLVRTVFERLEVADGEIARWTPRDWCRPFF